MSYMISLRTVMLAVGTCGLLASCGPNEGSGPTSLDRSASYNENRSTFFDLFNNRDDPERHA